MNAPDFRQRLGKTRETYLRDIVENNMTDHSGIPRLMKRAETLNSIMKKASTPGRTKSKKDSI